MVVVSSLLFGLILICFTGFFVFSSLNYKRRFNVKYNPLNMFPYELNYEQTFRDNFFGNLFLFFVSIIGIVFYVLIIKESTSGFIILLAISGILSSLLFSFIPLINLKYLKKHLSSSIFFFVSTLVSLLSNALIALNYHNTWLDNSSLVLTIIFFVFGGLYLIVLFNPKISLWTKMEVVENSDGTSFYKRPKFFPLAYTEWLSFIFYLISYIIL